MHISITFWLITFFAHFLKTFSTDLKSAWNSVYIDTHINFLRKKMYFALISIFSKLWWKCAWASSKKRKTFSYKHVLEFNYATINGLAQPSCLNRCTLMVGFLTFLTFLSSQKELVVPIKIWKLFNSNIANGVSIHLFKNVNLILVKSAPKKNFARKIVFLGAKLVGLHF